MAALSFLISLVAAAATACVLRLRADDLSAAIAAAAVLALGGIYCGLVNEGMAAQTLQTGCAAAVVVLAIGELLVLARFVEEKTVLAAAAICVWFGAAAPMFAALVVLLLFLARLFAPVVSRAQAQGQTAARALGGVFFPVPAAFRLQAFKGCAAISLCGIAALLAQSPALA